MGYAFEISKQLFGNYNLKVATFRTIDTYFSVELESKHFVF